MAAKTKIGKRGAPNRYGIRERLHVRMTQELHDWLAKQAREEDRTINAVAVRCFVNEKARIERETEQA